MKNYSIASVIFLLSPVMIAQPEGKYNRINKPNQIVYELK